MFQQVIDKAVELFNENEYDDEDELLTSTYAWDWALDLLVKTDHDALTLVAQIIGNSELRSKIRRWVGQGVNFAGFILDALRGNEEFGQMVADKIENYQQIFNERYERAAARAANL
jgi:hypothetical protein